MRTLSALLVLLLAASAALAQQGPAPRDAPQDNPIGRLLQTPRLDSARSVVLIFSHGTYRPQRRHVCNEQRDVPTVVREVANDNGWSVHYLCSAATDENVAGSYTYKRADEILAAVAELRRRGVPARRIFLFGHSAGGWSSLMAARKDHSGFNAIVAFAPAFAGPRHEEAQYPHWRRQLAPQQTAYLRQARRIDALIFAYPDDTFDRPTELKPLESVAGVRVVEVHACSRGHNTTYTNCFRDEARREIEAYIKRRLAAP